MTAHLLQPKNAVLGMLTLLLGSVACNQTPDGYDGRWLLEADSAAVDFGTVYLPEASPTQTITLTNTGRKTLQLAALSNETLQVDTPTFLFVPSASTCASGALLAEGESCTLAFTFTPSVNTAYDDRIELSWRSVRDNPDREETFSRTLTLRGVGDVDCDADPAWTEAYAKGKDKALQTNAANYDRGYDAGQALQYDDGHRRGYDATYGSAYDSAYEGAYERAYGYHYEGGYDEGWYVRANTFAACQSGGADGSADGSYFGDEDGWVDGSDHGSSDGANDGYNEAWDRLSAAESWGGVYGGCEEAAGFGASATAALPPPPSGVSHEAIAGMCEDKGFDTHRDPSAYDEGYTQGALDNPEYQSGLREGRVAGKAEGTTDGTRSGTRDGREDGYDDGVDDGKADAEQRAYDDCYDAAYPAAYASAYDFAYSEGYWNAYDSANDSAFYGVMDGYYASEDCDAVLYGE